MNRDNTKRSDVDFLFLRAIGTLKAIDLILDIFRKLEESNILGLILDLWTMIANSGIMNIGLLG